MDTRCKSLFFSALILLLPINVPAALVEFEASCNTGPFIPSGSTGNCALFGLSPTDTVSGSFSFDDSLLTPGIGQTLTTGQYEFDFTFGNQVFAETDNTSLTGDLIFLVSVAGTTISSILATFENANGAKLILLTPATVVAQLMVNNQLEGADTFAQGEVWRVSGIPSPIPVPAAFWLFASALGLLCVGRQRK